ncbi:MFS transporter [Bradyrhizobium sp. U87765 SZCCT0131]|uniref:MFS transporter n=1 Tax=unclassified Bradyrhizobium TaxID=2631580 RepID=UPI001BAE4B16|nr:MULTISPECIES: MFS transporter [unclassified Bradyrhizobium]MBR1220657.1 MFS transporter [Bradyrhizobium sp. U87765 SZCCT0131]MBR1262889.1 MFS transporter [Bradyrhizobium sp. U87765 SZCCT0134]MBR1307229.1 MFS transporter [Bradyrhizobium sp. U87765 SZCCT0110]MBR1322884.1 MFS transporter [Bradyrhizobium sp. U87765 SZCCT0109]MBR1346183.1 MFS transporter [Bradyrhizobium sp. U87765 SZCCT0048]
MLEALDRQTRLTISQRKIIAAAMLGNLMDFFDYFIIGFVLAFIIGPWGLTFGQSSLVLLSSGAGAMLGGFFWGFAADRIGRRPVFLGTILTFSLATGALALTPDHGWIYLIVFRFIVGFGAGGLYSVDIPFVLEFIPSSRRALVTGIVTTAVGGGVLLGALAASTLTPMIGWRGLFALGLVPALGSFLLRSWVPESPRWLLSQGRPQDARRAVASVLEVPIESLNPATATPDNAPRFREIFGYPRSVAVTWGLSLCSQTAIYGVTLWAPTLLILVMHVTPQHAAALWIGVGVVGVLSRFLFSWLADRWGRRLCGIVWGCGASMALVAAAYFHDATLGGLSVFYLMLLVWSFIGDGALAVAGPYVAEIWPSRLRATGMGSAYGFGGLGKILGPGGLALVVGSSNVIKPEVSLAALMPSFIYFAAFYLLGGLIWAGLGIETKGQSLEAIERRLGAWKARRSQQQIAMRSGAALDK